MNTKDLILEITFLLVATAAFLGALIGVNEYIRVVDENHQLYNLCQFYG